MSNTLIVSIDPGKDTGFSAWLNGTLFAKTALDGDDSACLSMVTEKILKRVEKETKDKNFTRIGLIEDGFVGPNKRAAMSLARKRGIAQAVLEINKFEKIEWIYPSTWQHGLFKEKLAGGIKTWAMEFASKVANEKIRDSNIADSICIAFYYLNSDKL